VELEFTTGRLRILSPTDCVKDRLAGYYFWKDLQCLEQAILVAADNDVDVEEIERWSKHEGMLEEFSKIRGKLVKQKSTWCGRHGKGTGSLMKRCLSPSGSHRTPTLEV